MNRPVPFQPARRRAQRDRGRSGSQHSANGDDSDDELAALIAAAGDLPHPLRADTHQTMIALLAVTGLRIGEAISLDINDLDPERGVLVVREGKFSKTRQLPLHASTVAALTEYLTRRAGQSRGRARPPCSCRGEDRASATATSAPRFTS